MQPENMPLNDSTKANGLKDQIKWRWWAVFWMGILQWVIAQAGGLNDPPTQGIVSLELSRSRTASDFILQVWNTPALFGWTGTVWAILCVIPFDFLFIAAYVGFFYAISEWLISESQESQAPPSIVLIGKIAAGLAFVAGIVDGVENIGLLVQLAGRTDVAFCTFVVATAKFIAIGAMILAWAVQSRFSDDIKGFLRIVRLLGAHMAIAGLLFALLFFSQGVEIIRTLAEDIQSKDGEILHVAAFLIATNFFMLTFYVCAELLIHEVENKNNNGEQWAKENLPRYLLAGVDILFTILVIKSALPILASPPASVAHDTTLSSLFLGIGALFSVIWPLWSFIPPTAQGLLLVPLKPVLGLFHRLWPQTANTSEQKWFDTRLFQTLSRVLLTAMVVVVGLCTLAGYRATPGFVNGGSALIVILSFAAILALISFLADLSNKTGYPLVTGLFVLGFVWSALDLDDNHQVRSVDNPRSADVFTLPMAPNSQNLDAGDRGKKNNSESTKKPLSPEKERELYIAFKEWLGSRPDRDPKQPYPVVFVAAEGGGIRAAYQTATALAALQQTGLDSPHPVNFSRHVFAISSVSGGSLGAAVFAALTNHATADGRLRQTDGEAANWLNVTNDILKHDLLSYPFAMTLGPDLIQRFVPVIGSYADRSRGLEYSLEWAFQEGTIKSRLFRNATEADKANDFKHSFYQFRKRPFSDPDSNTPALFFNSTCVETGERMVVADLWPKPATRKQIDYYDKDGAVNFRPSVPGIHILAGIAPTLNPPFSTAACLSARFPLIQSVATVHQQRYPFTVGRDANVQSTKPVLIKRRYIDGGAVDNSGITTLRDVIALLRRENDRDVENGDENSNWYPIVVTIRYAGFSKDITRPVAPTVEANVLNETPEKAPFSEAGFIQAGLDAYVSLNGSSFQRLKDDIETYDYQDKRRPFLFDIKFAAQNKIDVPLGWFLAKSSRKLLQNQSGYKGIFDLQSADYQTEDPKSARTANKQNLDRIIRKLIVNSRLTSHAATPATPSNAASGKTGTAIEVGNSVPGSNTQSLLSPVPIAQPTVTKEQRTKSKKNSAPPTIKAQPKTKSSPGISRSSATDPLGHLE